MEHKYVIVKKYDAVGAKTDHNKYWNEENRIFYSSLEHATAYTSRELGREALLRLHGHYTGLKEREETSRSLSDQGSVPKHRYYAGVYQLEPIYIIK